MSINTPEFRLTRCSQCGEESPENTIQCISCGKVVLGQGEYFIFITVTVFVILANLVSSLAFGYPLRSDIFKEVVYQMYPAIFAAMLLFKFIQKIRSPSKCIVQEVVAIFSDVVGRLIILVISLLVVWLVLIFLFSDGSGLEPHRLALLKLSTGLATSYLFLYFSHLGLAFFNFGVRDSIVATRSARLQFRKNSYIKMLAHCAAQYELQQGQKEVDLSFFVKAFSNRFGMTPEQGEVMLRSVDPHDFSMFKAACRNEILKGRNPECAPNS